MVFPEEAVALSRVDSWENDTRGTLGSSVIGSGLVFVSLVYGICQIPNAHGVVERSLWSVAITA